MSFIREPEEIALAADEVVADIAQQIITPEEGKRQIRGLLEEMRFCSCNSG